LAAIRKAKYKDRPTGSSHEGSPEVMCTIGAFPAALGLSAIATTDTQQSLHQNKHTYYGQGDLADFAKVKTTTAFPGSYSQESCSKSADI
ncbi:hypothetical protein T07_3970, partial [Trichinella nelsoni]